MTDGRHFVFAYPTGLKHERSQKFSGIYPAMPFCIGGRSRTTFPVNIECATTAQASHVLRLIQPIVDKCVALSPEDTIDYIEDDDQWRVLCNYMDRRWTLYWVVSQGRRPGIFVTRSGAEQSLVEATAQRWRRCDRYSTFHGAFVGLLSNNEIKIDYLGADLGDEEESGDDLPVSPPTPMLTPGKQGHRSPAIPPEGSAISSTPRPVNHPLVLSSHGKPRTFGKSSSLCSPSEDKPSSGINVQISPKVDIRLRTSTPLRGAGLYRAKFGVTRVPNNDYGYWFNHYLETHGFDVNAADSFHDLFIESVSEEDFVNQLVSREITYGEATFLFHLMQDRPGGRG